MKDSSLIPPGSFCYFVVALCPGEILSTDRDRYGFELREFLYHPGAKAVLCPYWQMTDYGMVRCDFMEVQSLNRDYSGSMSKALNYFGSEEEFNKVNRYSYLYDEQKICGINDEEDD
jgi:hypothetical protein